ncbi:unnamed protein product, partial [Linum tenue]
SSINVCAEPSYLKFVANATAFPSEENYDYVIVGGGTAGCPLAATLSQSYKVLLLERGGVPYGRPSLMTQEGFLTTLTNVLGGSSTINAGFYSRADPDFYKYSGANWDLRVVNESYEWVERAIVFRPELRNWQSAHEVGTKIGGSTFDGRGRRHSAADLLNYANASNINVAVYASVERVLLAYSGPRGSSRSAISAIGVVYREVILSAGAIGTPQLLLLSGIGPRPYLSYWGIPVAYHLPYVGQYLYDNPRNGISFVPPVPLEHSLIQVVGITELGAYVEAASNVIPFVSPARSVFIRAPSAPLYLTVATLMEKIVGPQSVGYLRLSSTDVRMNPLVRFNYFSSPIDMERCVNGTRKIGDVLRTRAMADFRFRDWYGVRNFRFVGPALPVDQSDFEQMADFCRRTVSTIWHYHGGCVVGKVVDADYRVYGIRSLRIVDGSTLTISPGTNPQATLMMLGR